jgi:hypothetical protein
MDELRQREKIVASIRIHGKKMVFLYKELLKIVVICFKLKIKAGLFKKKLKIKAVNRDSV